MASALVDSGRERRQLAVFDGRRVPIVVLLVVAAVGAVVLGNPSSAPLARARDEGRIPAAALAPAGVRSAVWYCAFATADRTPRANDAVILTNLEAHPVAVAVSAMASGRVTSARRVQLAAGTTVSLQASDIGAVAGAGVLIEPFGSGVVVDHRASDGRSVARAPCATRPSSSWYVAAGSTRRGTIERIALFNPFTQTAVVDVTAYERAGATRPGALQGLSVAPRSRVVINVNAAADQRESLGLAILARRGTRVVAEVALERRDSHGDGGFSIALASPSLSRDWHLASDGRATASGVVSVMNPGSADATVRVQTIVADVGRATETFTKVDAGSMASIPVRVPAGRPEIGVRITTDTPSIAVGELISYTGRRAKPLAISIVAGSTFDARRNAFASPGPGAPLSVTLLVANSSTTAAHATVQIGVSDHVTVAVGRDSLTAVTLPLSAETEPLLITSNVAVYVFRRLDDGTSIVTEPAIPAD